MCWVEIVRRELRFLDVGDVDSNRLLLGHLNQTQVTLQSDAIRGPFQVFRGRQRAIAELMMVATNAPEGPRSEAMGFATFCARLDADPVFAQWFERIRFADIDSIVVVDEDGRLLDDVTLGELLLAEPGTTVGDLVGPPWPVTVPPGASVAEIAARFGESRRLSVVVVDEEERPVGRILADDVLDMLRPPRGKFHFPRVLS